MYYLQTIPFLPPTAQRITACVTVLEDTISVFLRNQLHLKQRFCQVTCLPIVLDDQQHGGNSYCQQHQFLLFARMSSSEKWLFYSIKTVERAQSIIIHEQAELLAWSYLISNMLSQLFHLFGGIFLTSTVISRFWPNF